MTTTILSLGGGVDSTALLAIDLHRDEAADLLGMDRADLDRLGDLVLFLLKDCCQGRAELCQPLLAELAPCCD